MHPQRLADGVAYDASLAKPIAVATLLGLLLTRARHAIPRRIEVVLLVLLWLLITASTWAGALKPAAAVAKWEEVTKILLMAGVALALLQEKRKLHVWLTVLAMSIGAQGILGAIWGLQTGLRERLFGPPESQLFDNNALGFAFTMALPLLAFLRLDERVALVRHVLLAMFGATIIALFATYSRGAMVGFVIVLPSIALLTRTRDKPLLLVGLAACLTIYVAPREWVDRMRTITPTAYRSDSSGSERMRSWHVAWRLGLDHPFIGAGCYPFSPDVYRRYLPGYSDFHDAHNHYLQMLAEHGFTGLALFVLLLASVVLRMLRLARAGRGDPDRAWVVHSAEMIGVSLIAYLAGGVFINQPHSEWLVQLVVAAVTLDRIAASPMSTGRSPTGESLLGAALRRLRRRRSEHP
jgi:probable O-glycosylation ligase (exosortase A-associated)